MALHFVTSGVSQPHFDDGTNPEPVIDEDGQRYSGFDIELEISTIETVTWTKDVLINLVNYILFQKNEVSYGPETEFRVTSHLSSEQQLLLDISLQPKASSTNLTFYWPLSIDAWFTSSDAQREIGTHSQQAMELTNQLSYVACCVKWVWASNRFPSAPA